MCNFIQWEILCNSIKWLRVQCSTILRYKVQYSEVTEDRNELPPLLSAQRCLWHVLYILEFCPEKRKFSLICFVLMYFVFFLLCAYVFYLLNLYLYKYLCVCLCSCSVFSCLSFCVFVPLAMSLLKAGNANPRVTTLHIFYLICSSQYVSSTTC